MEVQTRVASFRHSTSSTSTATAELLLARSHDDAVDRRDIGKIPPHRQHDVIVLDQDVIGRIEADPADLRTAPQRDPGVGRVRALQARLARRRDGAQIAADIGRRQSEAAQPAIITCAKSWQTPWRFSNTSSSGVEITVAFGSYLNSVRMRRIRSTAPARMPPRRRKARGGIGGDRLLHRHQRARKDVSDRRSGAETGGLERHVANALPRRTLHRAAGGVAGNRHPRSGIDAKVAMRGFDQDALGMSAEEVAPNGAVRGSRPDIDGVRDQLLSVAAPRLQPQRTARETDRTFVSCRS